MHDHHLKYPFVFAFIALLSACNGGGGGASAPVPPVQAPQTTDQQTLDPQSTLPTQTQTQTDTQALPQLQTQLPPTTTAALSTLSTSGSTSLRHVMTVDYIGTPFGTTSVAPDRAAAYLSWAVTGANNLNTMARAGMKTMMYVDVNRQQAGDPLYRISESAFAHTCSGVRVHDVHDSVVQYLMNPQSAALRTAYASFIASRVGSSSLTAVFQDDSVPPGVYPAGFWSPTLQCGYSQAAWQYGQRALQAAIPHNTMLNGIAVSGTWPLLDNASTIGGNYEGCYTERTSTPERGGSNWISIQQTHLYITGRGKYFECMGLDTASAASAIRSRLYQIASFLMVYNPARSMLWETYGTPSHLTVMPESQLVALSPIVSVSNIGSLRSSTGAYVREYRACYYAGRAIGACAMVVNPDGSAHSTPRFVYGYHHTIQLHGYGAVDGGYVSFNGPAPSSLGGLTAYVAVP